MTAQFRRNDVSRAIDALYSIQSDLPRDQWVRAGMGFHSAGGDFESFDQWSAPAGNYNAQACRATWRSFKANKGTTAATLFGMAHDHGWTDGDRTAPRPKQAPRKAAEPPRKPAPGIRALPRCGNAANRPRTRAEVSRELLIAKRVGLILTPIEQRRLLMQARARQHQGSTSTRP